MNEHPFRKDTPVFPFETTSEALSWQTENCFDCSRYRTGSAGATGCKMGFYVTMGEMTGAIPLHIAKDIGCSYDPLYAKVKLEKNCRLYEKSKNLS